MTGSANYTLLHTEIGRKLLVSWKSDTSGVVELPILEELSGSLLHFMAVPVGSPTTLYDIKLLNTMGIDVLQGKGADISSASSIMKTIYPADQSSLTHGQRLCYMEGLHRFRIDNAGSETNGIFILYFKGNANSPMLFQSMNQEKLIG